VHQNGPTLSFEFEGHQADVIAVSEAKFGVGQLFYSYGDVGMILGMMVTAAGIKFGCKGLFLVRGDHGGQLHLSSDRSRILEWLGLSEADWLAGFEDEQAVFAWLCSCRFYRPSLFSSHSQPLRHNARRALSNRPMFVHFRQYVDTHSPANTDPADRTTAAAVQADAVAFFGCEAAVAALDAAAAKRRALKQCWNGELVAARTGLEGKQLGLFMMACRQLVTDDELLAMSVEEVQRFMDATYAKHVVRGGKMEQDETKEGEGSAAW